MNIVLIGMAGAGKSTIGVLLAKSMGLEFIDTDLLIQHKTGKLLQEILDQDGIDAFLTMEEKIVSSWQGDRSVVATGGSVVYSEQIMQALSAQGKIVYLHVPYEEIERRLSNIATRGVVIKEGSSLRSIYEERLPLYRRYADLVIDCGDKDMEQCVTAAMLALRGNMATV